MSNATSWDRLDQFSLLGSTAHHRYNNTLFMGAGKCSQYNDVVHQYIYNGFPYMARKQHLSRSTRRTNTKSGTGNNSTILTLPTYLNAVEGRWRSFVSGFSYW